MTQRRSRRNVQALAVLGAQRAGGVCTKRLEMLGLECLLCSPERVLGVLERRHAEPDLAVLTLEYEKISGPHLAWRLRLRRPLIPIVMLAGDLGTWEPADIYDCGVNLLIQGAQDNDAFSRQMLSLVKELQELAGRAGEEAGQPEYERLVNEIVGETGMPARLIDSRRLILYENPAMRSASGCNRGRNCFPVWNTGSVCTDCIALEALEEAGLRRRSFSTPDGRNGTVDAVPVKLPNGESAVVIAYGFDGNAEKVRPDSSDSLASAGRITPHRCTCGERQWTEEGRHVPPARVTEATGTRHAV